MASISIFGLGYVGCVSAACLAHDGHTVIGVDVNREKVRLLNSGKSPIAEPGLALLIHQVVNSGQMRALSDPEEAIFQSDVSFVCVGTPSLDSGAVDLQYVERVAAQIGAALRKQEQRHTIVFRSTMLPGTMEQKVLPILEQSSGLCAGRDFGLAYNPEFLREGSAISDFYEPSRTVIGQLDPASGDVVEAIYHRVAGQRIRTDLRTSEMVKYADNAFHATKVAFANEIGNLCKALGVDSHKVMDIFLLDTKLNLSAAYLRPGFAFGGSCLPKDLRALIHQATVLNLETALLRGVLFGNEHQKQIAYEMIRRTGCKKIGVLGISFKPGTDDLRESPAVELVERLVGKGYDVKIYDQNVSVPGLIGANRTYIERELPHLSALLSQSLDEVLQFAEVIIITQRNLEVIEAIKQTGSDQFLLDFVRVVENPFEIKSRYEGISW